MFDYTWSLLKHLIILFIYYGNLNMWVLMNVHVSLFSLS